MTHLQLLALWLVAGLLQIPIVIELVRQLRLQARLAQAIPDETWARLPPHPRWRPLWLASPRFGCAWLRFIQRDVPGENGEARRIKLALRTSIRRQIGALLLGVAAVAVAATAHWQSSLVCPKPVIDADSLSEQRAPAHRV